MIKPTGKETILITESGGVDSLYGMAKYATEILTENISYSSIVRYMELISGLQVYREWVLMFD